MQFVSEAVDESDQMVMDEGVEDAPRTGPLFPALSATDASVRKIVITHRIAHVLILDVFIRVAWLSIEKSDAHHIALHHFASNGKILCRLWLNI